MEHIESHPREIIYNDGVCGGGVGGLQQCHTYINLHQLLVSRVGGPLKSNDWAGIRQ